MASPTAPTISATGITAPGFADILAHLKAQYRSIYGNDVYLESDSQDGQFLAVIAAAINDSNAAAVACYNTLSPSTAQGTGLSSVVKINGLARLVSSASTVDAQIVGVAGTTITNGVVGDGTNRWNLPASVVIPPEGIIIVTATCATQGAITAAPNTVNKILTPVYGWQSVTNPNAAASGSPVETDAALRIRQAQSVALPSLTVLSGIVGAVSSISGVTQVRAYENDTDSADSNGLPPHSISIVAQGGDSTAIATAIMQKKTPGAYTHGTTVVNLNDQVGAPHAIRFYRPTAVPIAVSISLRAFAGYTTAIGNAIKAAVANYINGLAIGQTVMLSRLYLPAQLNGAADALTFEVTNLLIAAKPGTPGGADVPIAFNQVATCSASDVTLNMV